MRMSLSYHRSLARLFFLDLKNNIEQVHRLARFVVHQKNSCGVV